jgi:hypothetical protein
MVLPVAVSGVISTTAQRHPIARRLADPKEREWAAATLQVLCRHLRDTHTRVAIGTPIPPGQHSHRAAVHAAMSSLLAHAGALQDEDRATNEGIYRELATRT